MELMDSQKEQVRTWLSQGASLSDVQKNLKTEFGISMTYMDVRLLVLEMNATVKDKPEPKPVPPPPQPKTHTIEEEPSPYDEALDDDALPSESEEDTAAGPNVQMTLDTLVVPGAMVSGNVVFTDGTKARWLIDQQGRFGVDPEVPGYRPTPEDMQMFQMLLRAELQRKGYM